MEHHGQMVEEPYPDHETPLTFRELILDARPKNILLYPQSLFISIRCYILYTRISRRLIAAQEARDRITNGPEEYEHVSEWDLDLRRTTTASTKSRRKKGKEIEVLDEGVRQDAERFFRLGMRLMANAGREDKAARVMDELRHGECGRVVCGCCSVSYSSLYATTTNSA